MPFVKSGVNIAQVGMSRRERALQHQKSSSVTMGTNVPKQIEGAIGDITVRKIGKGLVCYIKTDSGWYDINALVTTIPIKWKKMVLKNNWVQHTDYDEPGFIKDSNGFVHLRGAVQSGSSATDVIVSMPPGLRPISNQYRVILSTQTDVDVPNQLSGGLKWGTAAPSDDLSIIRISHTSGAISQIEDGSTYLAILDGISYYAGQVGVGSGGGGSGGSGGSPK